MAIIAKTSFLNFANIYQYTDGTVFFDTPDFPDFPTNDKDKYITIDESYVGRLDLVAFDKYKDPELWWVLALVNNLDQVPTQVTLGLVLRVPSPASVRSYLAKGT